MIHYFSNIVPFLLFIFQFSHAQEPCIVDLECENCYPEYPSIVDSHDAYSQILTIPHGDSVTFQCHKHNFQNYPTHTLTSVCWNGQFNIVNTTDVRYFEELSCGANFLEDVLHDVDFCGNPYQGRSYQYFNKNVSSVQHLAEVCYDPETGRTLFAFMSFYNKNNIVKSNHIDGAGPTSVWGSFGKVFDSSIKLDTEKIFNNPTLINMLMKANLGKIDFNFQDQLVVPTKLLPHRFFQNQNGRASNFVSNKILMWKSIAETNYKNLQDDIVNAFKHNSLAGDQEIDVYVGTHETLSLPMNYTMRELFVKPGKKIPIPKYVWTIVHKRNQGKALAIIVINNPFITISDVRNAVLCPSVCHSVRWLNNLKYLNNYERPAYGLVYCCDIHHFTRVFKNVPDISNTVQLGDKGLLKEIDLFP